MTINKYFLIVFLIFSPLSFSQGVQYTEELEEAIVNKIAEENFEYPYYQVGVNFLSGKKLKLDYKKALFWLAKSSEIEKYNKSDFLIAEIYAKGLMGRNTVDPVKAAFFYDRSSQRGNSDAKIIASVYYLYNDVAYNKDKGLYWLNESIIEDNETAYQLYYLLTLNKSDKVTVKKQLDLILTRSEKGDHLSSFTLGFLYFSGKIIDRDLVKSKRYFLKAMNEGNLASEIFVSQIDKILN